MTGGSTMKRITPADVSDMRITTFCKVVGDSVVAGLFSAIGWFLWHTTSLDWWGLGVMALLCAAYVAALVIRSLRVLWSHGWYEWRLRRHLRTGTAPKSDRLASLDTLRKWGRIK
ncbi:hypothetical protein [uncultured Hoeflea sp.]|uniref:hypothetical protein n=1 Tax=uncultured Hoeflea sp. TaxID=538666 RepID=UPI002621E966|nr:hypothetical protein [uncultured Hoeflea sp.]